MMTTLTSDRHRWGFLSYYELPPRSAAEGQVIHLPRFSIPSLREARMRQERLSEGSKPDEAMWVCRETGMSRGETSLLVRAPDSPLQRGTLAMERRVSEQPMRFSRTEYIALRPMTGLEIGNWHIAAVVATVREAQQMGELVVRVFYKGQSMRGYYTMPSALEVDIWSREL